LRGASGRNGKELKLPKDRGEETRKKEKPDEMQTSNLKFHSRSTRAVRKVGGKRTEGERRSG